jgi:hypothetical protein
MHGIGNTKIQVALRGTLCLVSNHRLSRTLFALVVQREKFSVRAGLMGFVFNVWGSGLKNRARVVP